MADKKKKSKIKIDYNELIKDLIVGSLLLLLEKLLNL